MSSVLSIDFASHRFEPRADRSLWWPACRTLIVADLHVGKAAVFRARGVPVPEGATDADLRRLDVALDATKATRLLLLGDLFHARESIDHAEALAPLVAWRERRASLHVVLVRGNHDRHAGPTPASLAFDSIDGTLVDGGIEFAHEPLDAGATRRTGDLEGGTPVPPLRMRDTETRRSADADVTGVPTSGDTGVSPYKRDNQYESGFSATEKRATSPLCRIAGHVHPVVRLDDFDGSGIRVPCVCVDPAQMILPAFSQFTGGATMARAPGRTLYAIAAGRVVRA